MTPAIPAGLPLLIDRLRSLLGQDRVDVGPEHLVCRPATTAEVMEVLQVASIGGVKVSCSGSPHALLHLSCQRMDQLLHVDEISLLCEMQAGMTLSALERQLQARKLSLGPLPARSLRRQVGAVLSAPRPSEACLSLGRLRDRVMHLSAVVPPGSELSLPLCRAPRRASGPDLKQAIIGSAGLVAVITGAVLPILREPSVRRYTGFLFPTVLPAMRMLAEVLGLHGGAGPLPADVQVMSSEVLLPVARALQLSVPEGHVALLLRAEGIQLPVDALLRRVHQLATAAAAEALPEPVCAFWLAPNHDVGNSRRAASSESDVGAPLSREVLWPAREEALGRCSPGELAQAFDRQQGPRLLCGVHLHGAALCTKADAAGAVGPAPHVAEQVVQSLQCALGKQLLI